MIRTTLILCFALLGLAPGCSKRSYETAAPAPDGDYGSGGYGGEVAAVAEAPAEPAPMSPPSYGDREESYKKDAAYGPTDDAGSTPTTTRAAPARPTGGVTGEKPAIEQPKPKPTEATKGEPKEKGDEPQPVARQIIYTAELGMSVYKLDEAMERAEALTLEVGGYVQSMSQGYYVLRVPAVQLRRVMAEISKLGVVESRSLQAQDVTEEYVDTTTRIRVLREMQAQLITLLKQAHTVESALQVRRELDQVTMQLEQALGRLRMLESLIGFSTLTVRMSQRGPQNTIPSSNDPFPWVDGLGVEATEWN